MQKNKQDSFFNQFWYKFYPFWPLFIIFFILAFAFAFAYLKYVTPLYEATASIMVKDENKGADESKISTSLDYLSSKKIIENEVEVLRSKTLLSRVVNDLRLYAPVFEEGKLKPSVAYSTSPISVIAQYPDSVHETAKVSFKYNTISKTIAINNRTFPLNEWEQINNTTLKFVLNPFLKTSSNKNFYFSLIDPRRVAVGLSSTLDVAPVSKLSSVVVLKIKDPSPQRAEDILNKLVENYSRASLNEKNALATNTLAFVEERLNKVQIELGSIENKIQRYKSNKDAIDIGTQGKLFLENVSSNDQKLSEVNIQLAVLNQVESYVLSKDKASGIVPSSLGVNDPILSNLVTSLHDEQLEYEKLKKTTGENSLLLISVTDKIERIKPEILDNIRSQRKNLQATKENLAGTNEIYSSIIQTIPRKERELLEISREQTIKTSIFNFLLQKREEAALSNLSTSVDSKIVDKATASFVPVSPNAMLIYMAFAVIGFIIPAVFVFIRENLSSTVFFRDEIENFTSVPIVAEIAFEKSDKLIVIEDGKHGVLVEQFRRLRASFHHLGIDTIRKKILVTSTISGEGKSFIAVNLSLTLAAEGSRVVLLEADLRNPTVNTKLGSVQKIGISNYLKGETNEEEIIKQTEYTNLFVIAAGPFHDNSSGLFRNCRMESLLRHLSNNFDYIIIDSAPAGLLSDAYILSPLCDATLYVVRHQYTPKMVLKRLEENNQMYDLKNLAIVFNSVRNRGVSKSKFGYGYTFDYLGNSNIRIG